MKTKKKLIFCMATVMLILCACQTNKGEKNMLENPKENIKPEQTESVLTPTPVPTETPISFQNASAVVTSIKAGWNLGNALDSCGNWLKGDNPLTYECGWGNAATTQELISAVKEAGLDAVRVPVTWYQHLEEDGTIQKDWMERVKTVVDYVMAEDMYCIINVHHDTGGGEEAWLRAEETSYEKYGERYAYIWTQVAETFADYGEKLLFEGYNEMLDAESSWSNPKKKSSYEVINKWAQLFVDTVRSTGGKNGERNLIINTYGSDSGEQTVSHLVMPKDAAENHLIAEVHIYTPDCFTTSGDWVSNPTDTWSEDCEKEVLERFDILNRYFLEKDIPVIVGEFGAGNKSNEEERASYASYFSKLASKYGVAVFWWDDGGKDSMGLIHRKTLDWSYPLIRDALTEVDAE